MCIGVSKALGRFEALLGMSSFTGSPLLRITIGLYPSHRWSLSPSKISVPAGRAHYSAGGIRPSRADPAPWFGAIRASPGEPLMKRVLFVDDEPQVLDGIRSKLAPQQGSWEMEFAPGGEVALKLLGEKPFDVIVSDIRMPGMDGAELLKTVCQRFPSVVRIILSSQDELEGALRAVPVAHQFLVKPCDPAMIRVAIERATSLSALMNNKLLENLVGSVKDLPVL